jgi:hypothetical protein
MRRFLFYRSVNITLLLLNMTSIAYILILVMSQPRGFKRLLIIPLNFVTLKLAFPFKITSNLAFMLPTPPKTMRLLLPTPSFQMSLHMMPDYIVVPQASSLPFSNED